MKQNGVTTIYTIYTVKEKILLFVVFKRQKNAISGWWSLFILLSFSESKALAEEALVLGEISFLILLSSEWTSDVFSHLIRKTFF